MPPNSAPSNPSPNTATPNSPASEPQNIEKLAKQIADRVWKLWQEELRQTRERRKSSTRK